MTDRSETRQHWDRTEDQQWGRKWADHAQQHVGWSVHGTLAEDRMTKLNTLLIVADQCLFSQRHFASLKPRNAIHSLLFFFTPFPQVFISLSFLPPAPPFQEFTLHTFLQRDLMISL